MTPRSLAPRRSPRRGRAARRLLLGVVSAGVAALIFDAAPRVDGTGLVGIATVIDGDTLELKG